MICSLTPGLQDLITISGLKHPVTVTTDRSDYALLDPARGSNPERAERTLNEAIIRLIQLTVYIITNNKTGVILDTLPFYVSPALLCLSVKYYTLQKYEYASGYLPAQESPTNSDY